MAEQANWPGCSDDLDFSQHLRDGKRLRDRALEEFARALRTGRLIAFTGSMVSRELDYPSWSELLRTGLDTYFSTTAPPLTPGFLNAAAYDVNAKTSSTLTSYDVLMNYKYLASNGVAGPRDWKDVKSDIQSKFKPRNLPPRFVSKETTVERIVNRLGIRRVLTLNYDVESEIAILANGEDRRKTDGAKRWARIERLWDDGQELLDVSSRKHGAADQSFRRCVITPNGERVISDSFSRERTDRLFEFAIGASDIDGHVMHLHGRQDQVDSLIVSYADYERLYRRSTLTKLPFEHAMRSLYAGNPIVFIGLGMSEDEILFHLKQFVSDGSPHHLAPHFVIWSPHDASRPSGAHWSDETGKYDRLANSIFEDDELRRLRWYRQYGIYTIFDNELPGFETGRDAKGLEDDRLRRSIYLLSNAATKKLQPCPWEEGHFRSMSSFFRQNGPVDFEGIPINGVQVWSAEDDYTPFIPHWSLDDDPADPGRSASDIEDYLRHIVDHGAPIKAWLDVPGSGHGYIARLLRTFITERQSKRASSVMPMSQAPCIYAQINAGFAWEFDSAFELVSGLYDGNVAFEERKSRSASFEEFFKRLEYDIEDAATLGKSAQGNRRIVLVINGADRLFDASGYPLSADLDNLLRMLPNMHRKSEKLRAMTGYANPFSVFLFGTSRIARYLNQLGLIERTDPKGTSLVDMFGTLQRPFSGESWRHQRPGSAAAKSQFLDLKIGEWLERDFESLPAAVRAARWNDFPLVTERHPLITQREEAARNEAAICPSGTQQFKSVYLRAAEAAMRDKISIFSPTYRLPEIHRTLLTQFRQRGPHRQRRAFFDAYLQPQTLAKSFPADDLASAKADLALVVLRTLAFVGQPVEVSTLFVCPDVAACMGWAKVRTETELASFLQDLRERKLVCQVTRYPGNALIKKSSLDPDTGERYGLHRALLHEIRDRYTVPLSDARTYTSFNLPLFAAQPIDDSEPERQTYDDLQTLTHRLITLTEEDRAKGWSRQSYRYGMRLIAAAASMRSYYTTSALLMHEPQPAPSDKPSTLLTDHARLLEELITAFEANAKDRDEYLRGHPRARNRARCVFPDQLVWLHDQRAVALLAQGNLYEARDALRQARRINAQFIEREGASEVFGQNWRRITLNEVHVDIERAKLVSAEGKLRALEQSVNSLCDDLDWRETYKNRHDAIGRRREMAATAFETILQDYASGDIDVPRKVDAAFPTDAILIVGLICGYRGWCAFLAGELRSADNLLCSAVQLLKNLREQRAYAHFLRLHATVQKAMGHGEDARESIRLCLAVAEAGRQLDISYMARINRAELNLAEDGANDRGRILQELQMSLRYATLTDMFRVRMEARRALAVLRIKGGDYDGALEHASDALSIAMRFGFSLRKISMRTMIGEILILRGDPVSGFSMLDQAMREADRSGYQRAVERVHAVRMRYEYD